MEQFQADPDSLRTVLEPMDIPESSRRLIVAIQARAEKAHACWRQAGRHARPRIECHARARAPGVVWCVRVGRPAMLVVWWC